MKTAILGLMAIAAAASAGADCGDLEVPLQKVAPRDEVLIHFEPVTNADKYVVEGYDEVLNAWVELGRAFNGTFVLPTVALPATRNLRIRVIGSNEQTGKVLCASQANISFESDPAFRKALNRVIIPVAGSTEGAFGSRWRTSLALSNNDPRQNMTGWIVFHPAGQVASEDDPSLRYRLSPGQVMQWDDIVLALGASGLGNIDIVPEDIYEQTQRLDTLIVPEIQARVVNDTAEGATFGTDIQEVFPADLVPGQLRPYTLDPSHSLDPKAGGLGTAIVIPSGYGETITSKGVRISVGARYLDFAHLYNTLPFEPENNPFIQLALRRNGQYIESAVREFPPGYMEQFPLQDVFTNQLMPGDVVVIHAVSAIVYWTLTDNVTNDPTFVYDQYVGASDRIVLK